MPANNQSIDLRLLFINERIYNLRYSVFLPMIEILAVQLYCTNSFGCCNYGAVPIWD